MPILPRPEIEQVPPVQHGGFHSDHRADWLDFSSNVNPFGPSPDVWEAMRQAPIDRHPDPRATPLRRLLAEMEAVSAQRVVVGNGSVELIYHLAVAFLRPGDRVLVVGPTFGEYAAACAIMGAHVEFWRARPESDLAVKPAEVVKTIRTLQPRLIFLCNPNNPTGACLPPDAVEQIVRADSNALLVLDQAFVRFLPSAWNGERLREFENVIVLRSLTKDYALTGLRVGYAIAHAPIIEALEKVQPPWSVNTLAQVASMAALRDEKHLRQSLAALSSAKNDLVKQLLQSGMRPVPSQVNFFLLPCPSASELVQQLLAQRIVVRDCTSFGLPSHVRVAVRRPEDNARLVSALRACWRGNG